MVTLCINGLWTSKLLFLLVCTLFKRTQMWWGHPGQQGPAIKWDSWFICPSTEDSCCHDQKFFTWVQPWVAWMASNQGWYGWQPFHLTRGCQLYEWSASLKGWFVTSSLPQFFFYQVKAGCEATSAHAITSVGHHTKSHIQWSDKSMNEQDIIGRLYDFNHHPENWALKQYSPISRQDATKLHEWGGGLTHQGLHAIYTISFLCLLHIDEVPKIQRSHIEFEEDCIILTLPFWKMHQYGCESSVHVSLTTS